MRDVVPQKYDEKFSREFEKRPNLLTPVEVEK